MTPRFAEAVDPLFLHVFLLLERIDRQQATSAGEERESIERMLHRADGLLQGQEMGWKLAKYALVTWIDEMLGRVDWPGQNDWVNNLLEHRVFNSNDANELYFLKAKGAVEQSQRDAVDMYYVCVLLGFQGLYRVSDDNTTNVALIDQHHLPPDAVNWCGKFSDLVKGSRQWATQPEKQSALGRRILTATPAVKQSWIAWPWTLGVVLAGLNLLCYLWPP